jgi:hypothetical protein
MFSVLAKKLMPGDLHIHRSRVDLLEIAPVRADRPNAIDLMPGPFVAKHYQGWIGRRHLNVVQPIGRGMEGLNLAALDIDRIERHRDLCREPTLHHVALARIIIARRNLPGGRSRDRSRCRHWRSRRRRSRTKFLRHVADDHAARQQCFVSVQTKAGTGPQLSVLNDFARCLCVDIGLINRIAFDVKHLARFSADNNASRPALDDLFYLFGREIVGRQSAASRKHELVAISCVSILMEIERRTAGFIGEPHNAMTRVSVNPFTGQFDALSRDRERHRQRNERESYQVDVLLHNNRKKFSLIILVMRLIQKQNHKQTRS